MRVFFVIMLCWSAISLFTLPVFAQKQGQSLIDSLLKELPGNKKDTDKVEILSKLSFEYRDVNADQGIKYGEQALALAEQKKWKKWIARADNSIGGNYNSKSDFPKAMEYYLKALTINEDLNDSAGIATNSVNIGIIYFVQSNFDKALDYYFKALPLNTSLNTKREAQMKALKEAMSGQKAPDSMLAGKQKALAKQLREGKKELASNLADIGIVYSSTEEYPKAMGYYQKALVIDGDIDNKDGKGEIYANIGADYSAQNNYPEALSYSFSSLRIYQELGNKDGIAANLGYIGEAYLGIAKNFDGSLKGNSLIPADKAANLDKAIEYLNQGINISKEIGNLNYQLQFSHDISDAYTFAGRCDDALRSLKMYTMLKDSVVFSEQSKTKIKNLEKQREAELSDKIAKLEKLKKRNETLATLGAFFVLITIIGTVIWNNRKVTAEKQRSDELLLNILPAKVAEELKATGKTEAKFFDPVTVIFTDFVDFTIHAEKMSPAELIAELHTCFKAFDEISGKYGIEKIKTAGDAYMAVSGLPIANRAHAVNMIHAAIEIRDFMAQRRAQLGAKAFEIRIGVHSGSVVAGIVGVKKFAYDIWGDTVNTAARMEQNSVAGKINISETTYDLVHDAFTCVYRGEIEAKNKGSLKMYFVENSNDKKVNIKLV